MLTYNISKRGRKPKYLYLYECIQNDILSGSIAPGTRLPAKRMLAEHNGISVITVENTYNLLCDNGFAASKPRSGYYVCDIFRPQSIPVQLPEIDRKISEVSKDFPFSTLCRIMRKVMNEYGETLLIKPPHNGCAILRNAISNYLLRYRGMSAPPERIVIGSGAEYLYMMIVQLLGKNKLYGIENPSYDKIKLVYSASGADYEMLEMDRNGISDKALKNTSADVLHITPHHSFPTGITASLPKRLEYLSWAARTGGIIIEDDFDSEFAPSGQLIQTVYSLDNSDSVIYLNTFSKTLSPSMRMGYMIVPQKFSALQEKNLGFYSCTVPVFDQYVLAEFINGGYFERRLGKMRRALKNQYNC